MKWLILLSFSFKLVYFFESCFVVAGADTNESQFDLIVLCNLHGFLEDSERPKTDPWKAG